MIPVIRRVVATRHTRDVYNIERKRDKRIGPCRAERSERRLTLGRSRAENMRFRLPTLPRLSRRMALIGPQQPDRDVFGTDLRGLGPLHICPCGSQVFNVMASFQNYELIWYFLDGTCVSCGNLVTVPCPVDHPESI